MEWVSILCLLICYGFLDEFTILKRSQSMHYFKVFQSCRLLYFKWIFFSNRKISIPFNDTEKRFSKVWELGQLINSNKSKEISAQDFRTSQGHLAVNCCTPFLVAINLEVVLTTLENGQACDNIIWWVIIIEWSH